MREKFYMRRTKEGKLEYVPIPRYRKNANKAKSRKYGVKTQTRTCGCERCQENGRHR